MPDAPLPTDVPAEINCIECGYHLVDLAVAGVCPECATPIRRSMHEHLLRYEPITWLVRVASGIRIWHAGVSGLLVLPLIAAVFLIILVLLEQIRDPVFTRTADPIIGSVIGYTLLSAFVISMLFYVRGLWLMATPLTDGLSVLGVVRKPARVLAVAAPFFAAINLFEQELSLHPITAYALDGIIILALSAHVWTLGRMGESLAELVPSLTRKVRKRLRLARRDGWLMVAICALGLVLAGVNPILVLMFFYLLGAHGAFASLSNAIYLERLIALGHHAKESRPSSAETAEATD